ncbi:hypothetical protein L6R53_30700 [Myxococcota bacterium]|nr:hypothetical protein [Myxococcota bacterium]
MSTEGPGAPVALPDNPLGRLLFPILRRAGQVAQRHRQRWLDTGPDVDPASFLQRKDDGSPVTAADREAERCLLEGLASAFPDDAIVGEEGARREGRSGRTWVIDPIDGTDAWLHGLPVWGPTVACLAQDAAGPRRVRCGALLLPATGDYWFADLPPGAPGAAWLGGRRLRPLPSPAPDRAAVLFVPSRLHHAATVAWPGKLRSLGSTAAHLAWVASGGAAAALVAPSPAWDTAAGCALIEAVGGVVSPIPTAGRTTGPAFADRLHEPGPALVAGTPAAAAALLAPGAIRLHGDPLRLMR